MPEQNIKSIITQIKQEFINILSYSPLEVVTDSVSNGQTLTLSICYLVETHMHIDEQIVEFPILTFQCTSDWRNEDLYINKFYEINDRIVEQFLSLADMGFLNSLVIPIIEGTKLLDLKYKEQQDNIVNIGFWLFLKSGTKGANPFLSQILDEELLIIEAYDGLIKIECMQSERKEIKIPKEDFITQYKVPYDKIHYFNTADNKESKIQIDEKYIFVIMSFQPDPLLEDAYEAVKRAVSKQKKGLKCERVDEIHEDMVITDKITDCIKKAGLVIVDLTGNRPNVYYELGYARALNKNIILIAREGEKPHFDISTQNTIFYKNAAALERNLYLRLKNSTK